VEGLTEFLPISSTGHLIITTWLLDFQIGDEGTVEIFIQLGAVVAVLVYFARDIRGQIGAVRHDRRVQRFWLNIVIASVPAAILGFLFSDAIKELFFNPLVIALALIFGGVVFLVIDRPGRIAAAGGDDEALMEVTPRQALAVGMVQVLALIPGMSRSGSSIIGGLLAGMNRRTATAFSFYLALPILGGATLYELLRSYDRLSTDELALLIGGAIVSGIVAWATIRWLLAYVSTHTFVVFGIYRIAAGALILLLLAVQPR
jgi:undecaprenyl-diphosphatase